MVLVTGATGFVGATLVRQLVAAAEPVRILHRESSNLDLLGPAATQVEHAVGDVTDPERVTAAMAGVRHVYHAAAMVGFGGKKDREQLTAVNVEGTATVADAAREAGVERLVHVSSIAALGRTDAPVQEIDETATWQPSANNTAYAVSKYRAELEVQRAIAEGLDAVIVNPALVFGPGRPGENTMQIVEKVQRRRFPAIPTGGTCVVDVEDVAAGMRAAMARGRTGERYLLGGENLLWKDILGTLAEALGAPLPRLTLSRRPALVLATASEIIGALTRTRPLITRESARTATAIYRYDNTKAREELGVTFRPFRETAARIAESLGRH
ncbi:MAG TPA: NAD-dependent epimerase/dehydratase family protein [Rubricoccaceae bacterium]|nr:NAD-dependent epimerase/dehydratase family protein [Rubricoccaceae bacterium]